MTCMGRLPSSSVASRWAVAWRPASCASTLPPGRPQVLSLCLLLRLSSSTWSPELRAAALVSITVFERVSGCLTCLRSWPASREKQPGAQLLLHVVVRVVVVLIEVESDVSDASKGHQPRENDAAGDDPLVVQAALDLHLRL